MHRPGQRTAGLVRLSPPQMTVGTYADVARELKGQPVMPAEEQIEQARVDDGGRLVDVDAV
jgi:hypothetical protein